MSHLTLQGPFLTRRDAARRAGVPESVLPHRPDLLKVESGWLPEVYFAFQFDKTGVRPDLSSVVQRLKQQRPDMEIADWLVCPNSALDLASPLKYLNSGGSVANVIAAAEHIAPSSVLRAVADLPKLERPTQEVDPSRPAPRSRKRLRQAVRGRVAVGSR